MEIEINKVSKKVMGKKAGFDVVVMDIKSVQNQMPEIKKGDLTRDKYVVLITIARVSDEAAMRYNVKTSETYIGMSGGIAKCNSVLSHLIKDGITEQYVNRIFAPIGLDLSGSTPHEIAFAILAEIVAYHQNRNTGKGEVKSRQAVRPGSHTILGMHQAIN